MLVDWRARGELGVVEHDRVRADEDRIQLGPLFMRPGAGLRARDPAGVARGGRDLAVEAGRVLGSDERTPRAAMVGVRLATNR